MQKIILPIKGMHCASCAGKIEKSIKGVAGVTDAFVNIASEKASVSFDETQADPEKIKQAVRATGYDVYE